MSLFIICITLLCLSFFNCSWDLLYDSYQWNFALLFFYVWPNGYWMSYFLFLILFHLSGIKCWNIVHISFLNQRLPGKWQSCHIFMYIYSTLKLNFTFRIYTQNVNHFPQNFEGMDPLISSILCCYEISNNFLIFICIWYLLIYLHFSGNF